MMAVLKVKFDEEQIGEIAARVIENFAIDNGNITKIVRCKDCKYFENQCDCVKHSADILGYVIEVTPDDYCSYGERKVSDD